MTLDDIRATSRNRQPPDEGIMCELLWSDPQPMPGRSPSKRGVGCQVRFFFTCGEAAGPRKARVVVVVVVGGGTETSIVSRSL